MMTEFSFVGELSL